MGSYEPMRAAVRRIFNRIIKSNKLPPDLKAKIEPAQLVLLTGGETVIVETFAYITYALRERLEKKDEQYFKSEAFKANITKVLKSQGLMDQIEPETFSKAFSFADGVDTDNFFSEAEIAQNTNDFNILITNWPIYIKSLPSSMKR